MQLWPCGRPSDDITTASTARFADWGGSFTLAAGPCGTEMLGFELTSIEITTMASAARFAD